MATAESHKHVSLDFVRARLKQMEPQQVLRVAADAEISLRTVLNIAESKRDVYYSTVEKVYDALMKSQVKKPARKK